MDLQSKIQAARDAGYSDQQIQSFVSQRGLAPKKKGFLLDQISTAGGILGGIGGSFVAPVLGTAVGAAGGSGLGEAIENAITGDSLTKNVAKEAALGGVFGAGPLRLAKAGIGLAKGGKAVASAASAASTAAPKNSIKGKLTNLGDKLLTSQYGTISKPVARATRPEETLGQLANFGITKPDDVERIAKGFTGSSGLVNKAVTKAVSQSQRIPTDGIQQVFDDAVELNGLVDKDAAAVRSVFRAQMKKIMGGPTGSLKPDADPSDVLDVMKSLEKRAANLSGRGSNYRLSTPERVDQAKALLAVKDELQERLFQASSKGAGLSGVLTPKFRDQLIGLQPNNRQWQAFVDDTVMQSKDIGALRSTMAPFVRAGQIIDEGDINTITFGGRVGNLAGAAGGLLDPITGALTGALQTAARNPLSRAVGTGLRRAGEVTTPIASSTVSPKGIATRLGAVGAIGGALNQVGQASASPLEDALLSTQGGQPEFGPQDQYEDDSPFSPGNLQDSVRQILTNGGTLDDAAKFVTVATSLQKLQGSSQGKLTSTQQQNAVRAQNALNDVESLRQAIENGSINKTMIPGSGTSVGGRILGTTDIESALYNIGDVILRSRTGATAPPEEVKKFVSGILPRGGEATPAQLNKLDRVYRELVGMLNPPAALDDAPTTLEDALLAVR